MAHACQIGPRRPMRSPHVPPSAGRLSKAGRARLQLPGSFPPGRRSRVTRWPRSASGSATRRSSPPSTTSTPSVTKRRRLRGRARPLTAHGTRGERRASDPSGSGHAAERKDLPGCSFQVRCLQPSLRRNSQAGLRVSIGMIARTWRGWTRPEDSDAYLDYVERTGGRTARETPGNRGYYILRREHGDRTEFVTMSLWDSLDAIRAFAGDNIEVAFFPDDDRFLVDRERFVTHYEIAGP